jgi:hypothetical protein
LIHLRSFHTLWLRSAVKFEFVPSKGNRFCIYSVFQQFYAMSVFVSVNPSYLIRLACYTLLLPCESPDLAKISLFWMASERN